MIKIAICDDDKNMAGELENIINKDKQNGLEISINMYFSGEGLCSALQQNEYFDIIFLDIQMKGMSGIDTAKYLRNDSCNNETVLIFVSSYETYHKELYPVSPMAFISKPVKESEVIKVFRTALQKVISNNETFFVKNGRDTHRLRKSEIAYFESYGRKMILHTNNEKYEYYQSIADLLANLNDNDFIQIHKSYVVNLNNVNRFSSRCLLMSNNSELSIGAKFSAAVKTKTTDYIKKKSVNYV